MIVLPFKIPKTKNLGVTYQEDRGKFFFDKLHEHDEIQITRIVSGKGTVLVGNAIHEYSDGDIFVIGSNQPHIFKAEVSSEKESFMQSLFFTKYSFGKEFFELDDFREMDEFFLNSRTGFRVKFDKGKLYTYFDLLMAGSDFDRFLYFFSILKLLRKGKIEKLSSFIDNKEYSDNEGKKMRNIMDFTLENYSRKIDLVDVAEIANLTVNAFCRYFKQRTNKTYFTFLNEIRIDRACKLLKNKEYLITEVSEMAGFNNLSNFNRKFKELKKMTPSEYRISF
ncbi:AraC-type DNA-binding protein [Tenacibaculum sp. MAR_2009_124]|uniref:AraC family transcriptional regulator n=1 Tax=Tenacibaculum sp. MAR_2009_124 TaxID=1250059 RepID=UPI0008961233|nr:AraC family transcriptional regulator [Tenacibaculum sp. MAR_2009_124]SED15266.1 AraC-type DNA-binding protein [Tenacibaculum sp. MAR_2009_124]